MCVDLPDYMCIDVCTDMCIYICVEMCVDICMDVYGQNSTDTLIERADKCPEFSRGKP